MTMYRLAAAALTACAASLPGLGHKNVTTIWLMPQ